MGAKVRKVVGYVRVSTQEQGDSKAGLDAQVNAIERECEHHNWQLMQIYQDIASGSSRDKRPQLKAALASISAGEAETLMVSKLDRLSRSVADFGAIIEEARRGGWTLVIIDLGVDLATPAGEMVASIMAVLAQWERRVISQRTRDALAARKRGGTRLGRPVGIDPDIEGMIITLRNSGKGLRAVATELNRLSIPTSQGGATWHASSVRAILLRLSDQHL
jgi:DNA invertase Pin-like site-specific DNA recombinase